MNKLKLKNNFEPVNGFVQEAWNKSWSRLSCKSLSDLICRGTGRAEKRIELRYKSVPNRSLTVAAARCRSCWPVVVRRESRWCFVEMRYRRARAQWGVAEGCGPRRSMMGEGDPSGIRSGPSRKSKIEKLSAIRSDA